MAPPARLRAAPGGKSRSRPSCRCRPSSRPAGGARLARGGGESAQVTGAVSSAAEAQRPARPAGPIDALARGEPPARRADRYPRLAAPVASPGGGGGAAALAASAPAATTRTSWLRRRCRWPRSIRRRRCPQRQPRRRLRRCVRAASAATRGTQTTRRCSAPRATRRAGGARAGREQPHERHAEPAGGARAAARLAAGARVARDGHPAQEREPRHCARHARRAADFRRAGAGVARRRAGLERQRLQKMRDALRDCRRGLPPMVAGSSIRQREAPDRSDGEMRLLPLSPTVSTILHATFGNNLSVCQGRQDVSSRSVTVCACMRGAPLDTCLSDFNGARQDTTTAGRMT